MFCASVFICTASRRGENFNVGQYMQLFMFFFFQTGILAETIDRYQFVP